MDMPLVITGSGPSLEKTLPQILNCRQAVFIIAASSSLPALKAAGIIPDMVISTDGGAWALVHMVSCFRLPGAQPPLMALGLSAAIPSQCAAFPLLPISDGSLWQNMALNAIGVPSVLIPQRGTVTASALELALHISCGSIFLAGMDFSLSDIQSHARPYGFDYLFISRASRFLPEYSQYFMRAGDIQGGGSHDVYAAWFKSRLISCPRRIFSLGGNHIALEAMLPLQSPQDACTQGTYHFTPIALDGSAKDRCRRAAETLIDALSQKQYAAELSAELAPLLFPSHREVGAGEIAEALHDMAEKSWRTGYG